MLPLTLLKISKDNPLLVELKNGETYNGFLITCDNWMNISLKNVVCTSKDGDEFWNIKDCYIRGSIIKYLRISDEMFDLAMEESEQQMVSDNVFSTNRGRQGFHVNRGRGNYHNIYYRHADNRSANHHNTGYQQNRDKGRDRGRGRGRGQ